MERINVVSAVANLQKEMEFYRDEYGVCLEIIKQLSGEKLAGDCQYVNPRDVVKFATQTSTEKHQFDTIKKGSKLILVIDGQKYKQSPNMPVGKVWK